MAAQLGLIGLFCRRPSIGLTFLQIDRRYLVGRSVGSLCNGLGSPPSAGWSCVVWLFGGSVIRLFAAIVRRPGAFQ